MLRKVVKIRLYPTEEQQAKLAQAFGCSRWWWNYALNHSIETYKETGKGLGQRSHDCVSPSEKIASSLGWETPKFAFVGNQRQMPRTGSPSCSTGSSKQLLSAFSQGETA